MTLARTFSVLLLCGMLFVACHGSDTVPATASLGAGTGTVIGAAETDSSRCANNDVVAIGHTCDLGMFGPEGETAVLCADGTSETGLINQAAGGFSYSGGGVKPILFRNSIRRIGLIKTTQIGAMYDVRFTRMGTGSVRVNVYKWDLTYRGNGRNPGCIPQNDVVGSYGAFTLR